LYIPQHFLENDPARLEKLIDTYPFGTLITLADGRPFATHLPFIYDRDAGLLLAHVARANPQWRQLEGQPAAMAIFQGPHGYISPTWYVEPGVPTWDYAVVHVYGTGRAIDDAAATRSQVERLAARHERGNRPPWRPDYDARMLAGIVGIEIRIERIEGKFKLSQNRSAADRAAVMAKLVARGGDDDLALARLIESAGAGAAD
jgi:transcriptional regulator